MEHEVARFRCIGDDETPLIVLEYLHSEIVPGRTGARFLRGARRLALTTGEAVRYIDENRFEVVKSGELLRRR
jgi:hypothetical protein